MKRTLYSLLLIFLLSCGTGQQTMNPDGTTIFMTTGEVVDCAILSVRDSSFLIRSYSYYGDTNMARMHRVIPFGVVNFVRVGWDNSGGGILGFLIGASAGMLTMLGIHDAHGGKDIGIGLLSSAVGFYGGGFLGCTAGCYLDKEASRYYPYHKNDLEYLRKRSVYPDGEPDELKMIK